MKSKVLTSIFSAIILVSHQFFAYSVYADDYVVSGNGEGSSNNVQVENNNSESVAQSNDAEIKNDVKAASETGDNAANDNTGQETKVETGNALSEVKVENSANTDKATSNCCSQEEESSVEVTNNGSQSDNSVKYTQNSNTKAVQSNNLQLNNNILITANTGDNEASDNNGDVTIITGQVNILAQVLNHNLNSSYLLIAKPNPLFNIKVSGNGSESENYTDTQFLSDEEYLINNYLELNNDIKNKVNTGRNRANGNKGNVFITTGSIYLDLLILNKGNISKIIADCGCSKITPSPTPTPKPSESPSPTTPPSGGCCTPTNSPPGPPGGGGGPGGGSSGGSSGGGGQVLGVTLPGTGGLSIFQVTALALLILVLGVILRLDYGKVKSTAKKIKTKPAFPIFHNLSKNIRKYVNWKLPLPVPRDLFAYYQGLSPPLVC